MDISLTLLIGAAGLAAILILAIAAKVFLKVLKFLIFAVIIAVIVGFAWTQLYERDSRPGPSSTPSPPSRPRR